MASDSLNQIGKYIGKTGRTADRALKRPYPIQPRLERIRDVFDSTTDFEMNFVKDDQDKRVLLDLFFNLPPPIRGCKAGCIVTKCEEFIFDSGGNHYVTLSNDYIPSSVSVFVNGDKISSANVSETSATSGEVFYQSNSSGPDRVSVCYIHSDCPDTPIPVGLCPALSPSFIGGELLFSDRFDRVPTGTTYGGLGNWVNASLGFTDPNQYNDAWLTTPFPPQNVVEGGMRPAGQSYIFADKRADGPIFEVIMDAAFPAGATLTFTPTIPTFQPTNSNSSLANVREPTLSVSNFSNLVVIGFTTPYFILTNGITTQNIYSQFTTSIVTHVPIVNNGRVYIRYFYDGAGTHRCKVWSKDTPEPDNWFDSGGPIPGQGGAPTGITFRYPVSANYAGGTFPFSGNNAILYGISHWGGHNGTFNAWDEQGEVNHYSWSRDFCKDSSGFAPTGNVFFDGCAGDVDTITEFGTTDVEPKDLSVPHSNLSVGSLSGKNGVSFPSYKLRSAHPVFGPGPHNYSGFDQNVVSFKNSVGKTTQAHLTGEIHWFMTCTTVNNPGPLSLTVEQYQYGESQPATDGRYFGGADILQTIFAARDTWYPFDVVLDSHGGHYQWGVSIQDDPVALFGGLGELVDTGEFGLRVCPIYVAVRNLEVEGRVNPIGGAAGFCPEHDTAQQRCTTFSDTLIAGTYDYVCLSNNAVRTTGVDTQTNFWTLTQESGTKVEFNNSFKTTFRANGMFLDGEDGRCAPTNIAINSGGTSTTTRQAKISTLQSPITCSPNFSLTFQFKFGTVGAQWAQAQPIANLIVVLNAAGSETGNNVNYVDITLCKADASRSLITAQSFNQPRVFAQSPLGMENTLYNFRMDATAGGINGNYNLGTYIKIWKATDPEPSFIYGAVTQQTVVDSNGSISIVTDRIHFVDTTLNIISKYSNYHDDSFTLEVFNPAVVALDPSIGVL